MTRAHPGFRSLLLLSALTLLVLPGCRMLGISGGGGTARLASIDAGTHLELHSTTSAYSNIDENTADLYFTDLSPADLLPQADLKNTWGQFLHIRLFLQPKAGDTPIDPEANTIIIRHIIISDGQIGLYGGGGFMFDSGTPGDSSFGGSIPHASMKLLAHTNGFVDRIGNGEFSGSVSTKLNKEESDRLRRGLNVLLAKLPREVPKPPASKDSHELTDQPGK